MYLKEVQKIISNQTGIESDEIEPTSHFQEDLNMGEPEFIDLLNQIEEIYLLDLREYAEDIETVEDLITIITEELE